MEVFRLTKKSLWTFILILSLAANALFGIGWFHDWQADRQVLREALSHLAYPAAPTKRSSRLEPGLRTVGWPLLAMAAWALWLRTRQRPAALYALGLSAIALSGFARLAGVWLLGPFVYPVYL